MTKRLEEYDINYACKIHTVRMYTDGEYRCSCNKYKKQTFLRCNHIQAIQNGNARIVGARRYK